MPFDKLPGENLNTSAISNIHWYTRPPPPVFPAYEVTMNALNSILPAIDPVERAKRAMTMQQMQLAKESLPLERAKIQLGMAQINRMKDVMAKGGGQLDWNNPNPQVYINSQGHVIDERSDPAIYNKRRAAEGLANPYANPKILKSIFGQDDTSQNNTVPPMLKRPADTTDEDTNAMFNQTLGTEIPDQENA